MSFPLLMRCEVPKIFSFSFEFESFGHFVPIVCVDFSHIEKTEENTQHLEAQPYIHFEAYLLCVFQNESFVLVITSDVTTRTKEFCAEMLVP